MNFQKSFAYALGILSCTLLGIVYCSLFFHEKHTTQAMDIGTVQTGASVSVCVKDVSEVRIYTYMFHYIIPDHFVDPKNKIEYGNSIPPEKLEEILKLLDTDKKDGKIFISSLRELESYKNTSCFPNKNIVLLTVDDGWDDGYNYLFPLAKKYSIPFNLAIIAWKVSKTPAEINNFLNESEIGEMIQSSLFTVASHSFSHVELRNMTGAILEKELRESRENLENLFHQPINTIVFPSGKYDEASLSEAKKYGYVFGFTTKSGISTVSDLETNPLTLPRIRVNRSSDLEKIFHFE